jgi:hypothetical protein
LNTLTNTFFMALNTVLKHFQIGWIT